MSTIIIEPEGKTLEGVKVNTVLQLLNRLKLRPGSALVIRRNDPAHKGELLTPDLPIQFTDTIVVRTVGSRG